jgi:hypothetical protein
MVAQDTTRSIRRRVDDVRLVYRIGLDGVGLGAAGDAHHAAREVLRRAKSRVQR